MTALTAFLGKAAFGSYSGPAYDLPLPDQMVGLELEVDRDAGAARDTVFPTNYRPAWDQKRDGSLSNGYEYVLATPLAGQQLVDAVYQLYSGDTQVFRTYTGSTHIHLNMLDGTTLENLQALALLTYAMEGLLYYVGDNSRQWCGYANRMTGAPNAVLENILGPSVQRVGLRRALDNAGRYYGLNLAALEKYGTVEFRYFPTATSPEEMLSWVKLVQQLKKAACTMGNVNEVLSVLSDKSKYKEFVSTYLSDYIEQVDAVCSYSKVKILANKALVIANVPRTGAASWNKELLSNIFFKQPKLSIATPTIVPKNAYYYNLETNQSSLLPATQAMERLAVPAGKDTVILNYGGSIYYSMKNPEGSYQPYDWQPLQEVYNQEGKEAFNSYILAAREMGISEAYLSPVIARANGTRSSYASRHNRFVPFSAMQDTADVDDEDYDPVYDDEEEDY